MSARLLLKLSMDLRGNSNIFKTSFHTLSHQTGVFTPVQRPRILLRSVISAVPREVVLLIGASVVLGFGRIMP